ncbi:uncharacterized protein [Chiloscyllium punctatum]|uniref:uncharacterized protein n=1 Tax=Chiloscyllium punctatum TaxID=137246 RepID=UPI003B632DCE
MSKEHSGSDGAEEDHLFPGRTTSRGSLGQEHSSTTEQLIPGNSDLGTVTQTYPASVSISQTSNLGDWDAEKEFASYEAVTVVNSAQQISSEESRSTIEEVIGVLKNLAGSDADSETSLERQLSSTVLQASETERRTELPSEAGFSSNASLSLQSLENAKSQQREMSAVNTQTFWISWNTPGHSEVELVKQSPEKVQVEEESPEILSEPEAVDVTAETPSEEPETEDHTTEALESEDEPKQLTMNISDLKFCEFCNQISLPYPSQNILDSKLPEELFCCNISWMLYQQILKERAENANYVDVDSGKTKFLVTEEELSKAREKLSQRMKNTEVVMYMSSVIHGEKIIFCRLKTISYRLSSEYCKRQGWTLRRSTITIKPEDLSLYVPRAQLYNEPKELLGFVEKYYLDGKKFITRFPDGTGNVFYPSGNIAIVILTFHPGQLEYLIFQDLDWNAKILGVFRSNGYGTCYLPNGLIWINLSPLNGLYFNKEGQTEKQWMWRDYNHHVHAPPYQSINLELNSNITIQVISREQIYTTFKAKNNSITFNMGANLELRDLEYFHKLGSNNIIEREYLKAMRQKIHNILWQKC